MDANFHLSNKKALFWNMTNYYKRLNKDPFQNLPLTFHIENGLDDPEFQNFKNYFTSIDEKIKIQAGTLKTAIRKSNKRANKSQNALASGTSTSFY
jgi:hypothetical protein